MFGGGHREPFAELGELVAQEAGDCAHAGQGHAGLGLGLGAAVGARCLYGLNNLEMSKCQNWSLASLFKALSCPAGR